MSSAGIVDAVRRVPGARLLDYSSDASHNRSVITMAGDAASLKAAVLALFEAAGGRQSIFATHTGEHPRWAPSTSCRSCRSRA